jgi:hypothetical protein
MYRVPMASIAISSIRPLAFERNPEKRQGVDPKLKRRIGGLLLSAMLGVSQIDGRSGPR